MSPIAVSADRRFHRAHVKPARKRRVLRTVSWPLIKYGVIAAVAAIGAYRAAALLIETPVLQVDSIIVRGNHRLPSGEVLAALKGMRGENIVSADLGQWREQLLASPWIRDASFRRSLPSTIEVTVSE